MNVLLELAARVADRLAGIPGVVAVALGGSVATGTDDEDSDLDLGVYYRPESCPAVGDLRALARELDDSHAADLATDFGEWGPWINGGAWLTVEGRRVDWLYRDLDRVEAVIADCLAGVFATDYQPGHPHGFHNHMYHAEVREAAVLADPGGELGALKERVSGYPQALRRTVVKRSLWEAGFSLGMATTAAHRGDAAYVAGCCFRTVACLVQALFALNERSFRNEKGSVQAVDGFALCPPDFTAIANRVLGSVGGTPAALDRSVRVLQEITEATWRLVAAHI